MNKSLLLLALRGLEHLQKPVPVDLMAAVSSFGCYGCTTGMPIHPDTARAINWSFPDTFDSDDIAVFETTFFARNFS